MLTIENLFRADVYLAAHPDAAADMQTGQFASPLAHFLAKGKALGYDPGPLFDTGAYLRRYPDVKDLVTTGKTTAIDHFLTTGDKEGRDPITEFNTPKYLARNPDVAVAVNTQKGQPDPLTAYQHYIRHGRGENRALPGVFDPGFYLSKNPTVASQVQAGQTTAIDHFLTTGRRQGLKPLGPSGNNSTTRSKSIGKLSSESTINETLTPSDDENGGDLFAFEVDTQSEVQLALTSANGEDLDFELLNDIGGDGELDLDDVIGDSDRTDIDTSSSGDAGSSGSVDSSQANDKLSEILKPGTYYLRVISGKSSVTTKDNNYSIKANVAANATPPRTFPQPEGFGFYDGYGLVQVPEALGSVVGRSISKINLPESEGINTADLNLIGVGSAWQAGYTGKGIVVAVLDDGVDIDHPEFAGRVWVNTKEIPNNGIDDDKNGYVDDVNGWNFVDNNNNPRPPKPADDHGTHVAGSIGAARDQTGTVGVAPEVTIMPIRLLGKRNGSFDKAARYAVDNGATILNMSLGADPEATGVPTPIAESSDADYLQYARSKGVAVVIAAGNERDNPKTIQPGEPAFQAANGLGIAVGAIDTQRKIAYFSNPVGNAQKKYPYVVAPGVKVQSTLPNSKYDSMDGTSMATPHVAGVLALLKQANPTLTPAQLENIVTATANRAGITV